MSRTCTVCTHRLRQDVELALISGQSLRDIAGQFGLSKTALDRHRHDHLSAESLTLSIRDAETRGEVLLAEADALLGKASALLLSAEESGDTKTALTGVKEARGCIELLAKLQPVASCSSTVVEVGADSHSPGSGSHERAGLDHGKWMLVCQLLGDILGRWPTLANSVAGGFQDAGLHNAAAIVVSAIPETLRIERVEDPTSHRLPRRQLTTKDLESIRTVILDELRSYPEVQWRIAARLRVVESAATGEDQSN